jgi:glucose uptake protein GlcU
MIMNKLKLSIAVFVAVIGLSTVTPLLAGTAVQAQSAASKIGEGVTSVGGNDNQVKLEDRIRSITNILLFVLGVIAVIAIIIGGFKYVTSNGDASQTKSAKDTILYAVVGLVVAILAYAIVGFILNAFEIT